MNWKELYALVNENIKKAVSGLYKPAGDVTFAELPELSQSVLGYTYTVTDAFTTDSRFTDYDTESQTGHSFPADTEVAVIVTGTTENPVYMFNVMGGIMDGYATKGDLDNYVEKEAGKSLSTNDYTDADKALVQNSPITTTVTGSDLTLSTSAGNINALTVYGKSEVVDGSIKSAGEGWGTVDLGTLTWLRSTTYNYPFFRADITDMATDSIKILSEKYNVISPTYISTFGDNAQNLDIAKRIASGGSNQIMIRDDNYTDAAPFKSAMSGVLICYELADPTQGNCIAVKNDNGSGIDGTMATFTTGTPLRGVPNGAKDVAEWDGSSGEVTKNCGDATLSTLEWSERTDHRGVFFADISDCKVGRINLLNNSVYAYDPTVSFSYLRVDEFTDNRLYRSDNASSIFIKALQYANDITAFEASLNSAHIIYELATPTTTPLTTAENASVAGLRTFEPQTHAQNNAGATMTVEAYAGTGNGKAVADLKSELQITQSDTLTLTVAGWTNNAQTVTYAHDTSKRNVIDVDPASVEEWANCGILATAETANGITFTCKTVPQNALSFRVTSMGV